MRSKQRGLTLIELMVALTIAIILLAVGIPAFRGIEANNRAVARANTFVTALNLARSEAVGRGASAGVCGKAAKSPADTRCGNASSLTSPCSRDLDDANPWCNGLLVFVDTNSDGDYDDGTDEVIRSFEARGAEPIIQSTAPIVWFNSRGEQLGGSPVEVRIELDQADTAGEQVRCVRVAPGGQIVTERNACP